jgi:four helix bundle protein
VKTYRELVAWQQAMDLAEAVYASAARLPVQEQYGLSSQMRRAAVSIAANIAEGQGLGSSKAFIRHLWISHGSVRELETHVLLAERFGYFAPGEVGPLLDRLAAVGRLVRALIRGVEGVGPSEATAGSIPPARS